MKSFVAVLTFRRLHALKELLNGYRQHCAKYPLHIFEDCGYADATSLYLSKGPSTPRPDLLAEAYDHPDGYTAYLGSTNLGVSGNSNRAIKAFMDSDCTHLCLLNDDLLVTGDFVDFYAKAHKDLGVGLFCFNDFWEWQTHRWVIARSRGYRIKLFPQITGIMLSMTRALVESIGYFDMRFPKMGNEHVDYTHRSRAAGFMKLDGMDQVCIDVEPTLPTGAAGKPVLQHQTCDPSVSGHERAKWEKQSQEVMVECSQRYHLRHYHEPFRLSRPSHVGGTPFAGIDFNLLSATPVVSIVD
jgi:hypothetical protein